MSDYRVCLVTCVDVKEAKTMAKSLIKKRLAACVNLVPHVRSIYRWQGKIEESSEVLLLIKSKKSQFEALTEEVQSRHSYECPEIVSLPIQEGSKRYLDWVESSIS
jgi:periplasmic divalent cation tolerance protein